MVDPRELRLHEAILLLALKDEKGTAFSSQYTFGMAGALLAELVLEGRLALDEVPRRWSRKTRTVVRPADPKLLAHPVLDEALRKVHDDGKPRTPEHWIGKFRGLKKLKRRTATQLVRRGILRERRERFLLFFHRTVYPTLDPTPERRLVEGLRAAVEEDVHLEPRIATLVALCDVSGLLKRALGKDVVKARKDRIEALGKDDPIVQATRDAIKAARAAAVAAGGA